MNELSCCEWRRPPPLTPLPPPLALTLLAVTSASRRRRRFKGRLRQRRVMSEDDLTAASESHRQLSNSSSAAPLPPLQEQTHSAVAMVTSSASPQVPIGFYIYLSMFPCSFFEVFWGVMGGKEVSCVFYLRACTSCLENRK